MRAQEFIREDASAGATGSGSVATVATPIGGVISRNTQSFFAGHKYSNDETPNTPESYKTYKKRKK
jgi:hypothetical protein